jgi:tripartite-type tricarboxylate transporter receptor subunit TctC
MLKKLLIATIFTLASLASSLAIAQSYPIKPVTLVIPFPPGGGTDTGGRILAEQLSKRWGQPVLVENKGGAAGQIGAELVSRAKPDGYTLLLGNIGTQAINPSLYPKMSYDPDKAFAPISLVSELPLAMMVNPTVPAQTVEAFILLAKSKPGQLSYSSAGSGGAPHLAAEMFQDQTGTSLLHVPYRGGGPAIADLIAGHVEISFMTVLEASGHIKSGKLKALAVTGNKRVEAFPEVPTLDEKVLPGFNTISWIGLLAPAGTPMSLIEKISGDVRAILSDDAVMQRFISLGGVPRATTPAEFVNLIDQDRQRYAKIILSKKISAE